jgi:hypothetical protein
LDFAIALFFLPRGSFLSTSPTHHLPPFVAKPKIRFVPQVSNREFTVYTLINKISTTKKKKEKKGNTSRSLKYPRSNSFCNFPDDPAASVLMKFLAEGRVEEEPKEKREGDEERTNVELRNPHTRGVRLFLQVTKIRRFLLVE